MAMTWTSDAGTRLEVPTVDRSVAEPTDRSTPPGIASALTASRAQGGYSGEVWLKRINESRDRRRPE
jgi:hypothetical protein